MKWGIEEHESRITGVLRQAYDEHGWTPVEDHTPLDEMLAAEAEFDEDAEGPSTAYAWPSAGQPDLELSALKQEEAAQVAAWAREQLVRWLAGAGMHPFRIVQRFFALCFARYGDLIGPLNGTTLAEILGQGRAAFSTTMREIFGRPVEKKLGVPLKVPGQKSAEASEKYAENARLHKPRQQLDRDAVGTDHAAVKAEARAEAERRLKEQREAWKKRELERDAEAHAALTARHQTQSQPGKHTL